MSTPNGSKGNDWTDTYNEILILTQAKKNGTQSQGCCPCHDDSTPSLSLTQRPDGSPMFHCHAGCTQEEITSYFRIHTSWPSSVSSVSKEIDPKVEMIIKSSKEISDNSPVKMYLKSRSLETHEFESLLWNPNLFYEKSPNGDEVYHNALIGKIINNNEEIVGVQRIYLNEKGEKLPKNSKKVLGKFKGAYCPIGKKSIRIHITEGIENGLTINQATGERTLALISASNFKNFVPPFYTKEVCIWADKDKSQTGQKVAYSLAKELFKKGFKVKLLIPEDDIPSNTKSIDWQDIHQTKNLDHIRQILQVTPHYPWQKIDELPRLLPEAPPLPEGIIPLALLPTCKDIARRIQVPISFPAICLIVALSSIIGRKTSIKPKEKDDWTVIVNLWGGIVGRPGKKKSPAISEALRPLHKLVKDEFDKFEEDSQANLIEIQTLQSQFEGTLQAIKQAEKQDKSEKIDSLKEKLHDYSQKLDALQPQIKRYITNDSTIEKLLDLLKTNPNGILMFRDELTGFLNNMNKPGHESDRSFYLEGWNGNGSYISDRIGRGTVRADGICLSILGGLQPSKLNQYIADAQAGKNGDDGFMQRLQILIWPEDLKITEIVDEYPDTKARETITNLFRMISNTSHWGEYSKFHDQHGLRFSKEAQNLFNHWLLELEIKLSKIESPSFESHLSKYRSLFPSLALIFEIVDCIVNDKIVESVSEDSAKLAMLWCQYLEAHAKKIYSITIHPNRKPAHEILKKIKAGKIKSGDSVRTIYRNGWSNLNSSQEVNLGLKLLENHNYLVVKEIRNSVGRASEVIALNPVLEEQHGGKND